MRRRGRARAAEPRGFIMVEVSLTYVVLALAVVSLVPAFYMGLKANKHIEEVQKATDLDLELIEEIRLRKWDENGTIPPQYVTSPSTTLGIETGEIATDKTTFDDIDDFNGYSEHPVLDPAGRTVTGFTGYTRTVTVQYVTSNASSFSVSASTTDYKQVTVCAHGAANLHPTCLYSIIANR